ncbi:MAG: hypothetical protein CBR30_02150 [Dictyoglomus sp. NZ13-RE01]|nr:MAG: hypothetical protein CBR30_02150 [Dictyoglomus sp. NZ13-RE01]
MRKKRSLKRFLRYLYIRLIRINDSPEKIAMGFSVGVFIGIFPTFGFGGILALLLAKAFKLNYISAIIGTFIMNYFTSPIFWSLSYFVGSLLLEGKLDFTVFKNGHIKSFAVTYLIGNLIVSFLFSVLSYFVVKKIVISYRKRRKKKGGDFSSLKNS